MSSITVAIKDARLSILGYQPEVSRIYWSALPERLPTFGKQLDLSGCEITAVYADGSEAVVTDYCTFSPDTGATVPNANTLTVTATYTARSGKVCEADETLPICVPKHIKIIVPETVPILYTRRITIGNPSPTWDDKARVLGLEDIAVYLYWERNEEIVAITKVNADLSGFVVGSNSPYSPRFYYLQVGYGESNKTYTRYYSPTRSEEVTIEDGIQIRATYSIYGLNFSDSTYLSLIPRQAFVMTGVPTSYVNNQSVNFTTANNCRAYYKGGELKPLSFFDENYNAGNYGEGSGFYTNSVPHIYHSHSVTFRNGVQGSIRVATYFKRPEAGYVSGTTITYKCADGNITWTNVL